MVSKHIVVSGKVQGVGFRNFTQRIAESLRIIGWARNLATGEVEILAAAETPEKMQNFITRVKGGPTRGYVENMEIFDVDSKHIQGDTFMVISDGEKKSDFKKNRPE
jgi:acylphosphatase